MKKLLAIVLLTALFSIAIAEETTTEEILFRGIEWGVDMPTVLATFEGVSFASPSTDYAGTVNHYLFETSDIRFKDYVCVKTRATSLNGMKVAGYELSGLTLYFSYTPDESGLLPKDNEHTAFCLGQYSINPKDLSFVMNDLMQKLTKVYGEPAAHQTTGYSITYDIYAWKGANETIVSLIGEKYSSGTTNVYIRYSFYGADEYYQKAMNALIYEELLKTDADDTSGL